MIEKLTHTTIWVLDQNEALDFYPQKLGFEVNTDARIAESAQQVKALVAKGFLGAAAFETSDCRATYTALSERGVGFLSEPTKRPWGIEATLRDNSGNWFSVTQR